MADDKLAGRKANRYQKKLESIQLDLDRLACEHETVKEEHDAVLAELACVRCDLEKNLTAMTANEEEVFQLQLQLKIHTTENDSPSQQTVGEILQEHLKKVTKTFVLQEAENKELSDRIDCLRAEIISLSKQLQILEERISQRNSEKQHLSSLGNTVQNETNTCFEHPATADITALSVITFFSVFILGCLAIGKPKR